MGTESLDIPLNLCTVCGHPAALVTVGVAQPRYMARCTASRHYDPGRGRDHTVAGTTPEETQAAWNQQNPPAQEAPHHA